MRVLGFGQVAVEQTMYLYFSKAALPKALIGQADILQPLCLIPVQLML